MRVRIFAEVPVHQIRGCSPTEKYSFPSLSARATFSPSFLLQLFALFCFFTSVASQTLSNGQLFTNGILIIDAPSIGNPGHAGSSIAIAVDVSGNGQLSADSANPQSSLPTHLKSVEIYLVSAETNTNLTVSTGPQFLMGESGTVRHLNWPIPTCITPGQYNLTFYELSEINGQSHFIITPVSIPIDNTASTITNCTSGVNPLQAQPQPSTPLTQSPWLSPSSSGLITSYTNSPTATVITITLSGGSFNFPTITETATSTGPASTVVIVSMATATTTIDGQIVTTTETFTTTTLVSESSDRSGFLPVNASLSSRHPGVGLHSIFLMVFGLCASVLGVL